MYLKIGSMWNFTYKNQQKLRDNFLQNFIQVGMDLQNVQIQGKADNTQEHYPSLEQW